MIVRWSRGPENLWIIQAMDTEGNGWGYVDDFHEGQPIPPAPPTEFDDVSANDAVRHAAPSVDLTK